MRKLKLFSILALLLIAVSAQATTITIKWTGNDIEEGEEENTFSKYGVTLTAGTIDYDAPNFYGDGTFTTTLGNFTGIRIGASGVDVSGAGWSNGTWTGNASSVPFSGDIESYDDGIEFAFTIELAEFVDYVGTLNFTWTEEDLEGSGNTFTKDIITLEAGYIDYNTGNISGGGTFTTVLGYFTKIEVSAEFVEIESSNGWTTESLRHSSTWTGSSSSVSFSGEVNTVDDGIMIEFTIEVPPTDVSGITLDHSSLSLSVGEEVALVPTIAPVNATDKTVTWTSSDTKIAMVNDDGEVMGVAAGTATITATATNGTEDTSDDMTATCLVTVSGPVETYRDVTPSADPENPDVYYSTFFDSSVKYEMPTGVEAYVATISGTDLNLTKIAEEGQVIPANVAVILKATVTSFSLTPSEAAPVTVSATNCLLGTDVEMAAPANCYVISGHSSDNSVQGVGFYQYTGTLKAHKAYTTYGGGSGAPKRMRFIFEDEQQATGVENVQGDKVQSTKIIENGQVIIIRNGVRYNAAGQIVK